MKAKPHEATYELNTVCIWTLQLVNITLHQSTTTDSKYLSPSRPVTFVTHWPINQVTYDPHDLWPYKTHHPVYWTACHSTTLSHFTTNISLNHQGQSPYFLWDYQHGVRKFRTPESGLFDSVPALKNQLRLRAQNETPTPTLGLMSYNSVSDSHGEILITVPSH